MIDLSHLTEEEQAMIMTVLRRDAELKKAEEERVRLKFESQYDDMKSYFWTSFKPLFTRASLLGSVLYMH